MSTTAGSRRKREGAAGKSKSKGKAIHGRGTGARTAKKAEYENELKRVEQGVEQIDPRSSTPPAKFTDLPLSEPTLRGLQASYFQTLTPIQAKSLPYTLKSHDILGAARTGSGKTLAFIIPLLETLFRNKWGPNDGLGALVISPTRELAVQIFDVLRKVGQYHQFSAGLVIGGKSLKDEQERLSRMNILISTPGRLLQHMDQTLNFDTSNLLMLVLDEADRCLDLGFSKTIDGIVANLPSSRQTLLFSATQTKNIQALARLSLRDPVYVQVRDSELTVAAGEGETSAAGAASSAGLDDKRMETPKGLEQHYMVVKLDKKLDTLWSFVKTHLACKTLVFMSSCKQVRFVYETFRHLRPGIPLMHIHGKQKQMKRLEIYSRFTSSVHSVLFATDIAARGLDFPSVNWVVQLDCPEDVDTYIHRVGRTARYNSKGKSLLFVTPNEKDGFVKRLKEKGLNEEMVKEIRAKENKQVTIQKQFQSLAFRFPEIKFLAQRAFISYVRSVHLQKDKSVFDVSALPLNEFAESLGLAGAPKIKFISKSEASRKKNAAREVEKLKAETGVSDPLPLAEAENEEEADETSSDDDEDSDDEDEEETSRLDGAPAVSASTALAEEKKKAAPPSKTTKYDKMFARKNQNILSDHYTRMLAPDDEAEPRASTSLLAGGDAEDDQEDFITLARKHHPLPDEENGEVDGVPAITEHEDLSKRRQKLGTTKKGLIALRGQGSKLKFDDEGGAHPLYELVGEEALGDVSEERRQFLEQESARMQDVDLLDKAAQRELRQEKKRKRKEREREVDGYGAGPMDGGAEDDGGEYGFKEIDFGDALDSLPSVEESAAGETRKQKRRKEELAQQQENEDLEMMALQALKKNRRS